MILSLVKSRLDLTLNNTCCLTLFLSTIAVISSFSKFDFLFWSMTIPDSAFIIQE